MYRHAPVSTGAGHAGRKIQIQELGAETGSVRSVRVGAGANRENFVGACPVEREIGLEDHSVCAILRVLGGGGSRIVHPRPAVSGGIGDRTQCVGEGEIAAAHAGNGEGVVFVDDIVHALRAVSHQVAVEEVVTGQILVASGPASSKIARGRRGNRSMWTSLGAKPLEAVTKLLYENST